MTHSTTCPAHNHLYEVGSGNDLPECTCKQMPDEILAYVEDVDGLQFYNHWTYEGMDHDDENRKATHPTKYIRADLVPQSQTAQGDKANAIRALYACINTHKNISDADRDFVNQSIRMIEGVLFNGGKVDTPAQGVDDTGDIIDQDAARFFCRSYRMIEELVAALPDRPQEAGKFRFPSPYGRIKYLMERYAAQSQGPEWGIKPTGEIFTTLKPSPPAAMPVNEALEKIRVLIADDSGIQTMTYQKINTIIKEALKCT